MSRYTSLLPNDLLSELENLLEEVELLDENNEFLYAGYCILNDYNNEYTIDQAYDILAILNDCKDSLTN